MLCLGQCAPLENIQGWYDAQALTIYLPEYLGLRSKDPTHSPYIDDKPFAKLNQMGMCVEESARRVQFPSFIVPHLHEFHHVFTLFFVDLFREICLAAVWVWFSKCPTKTITCIFFHVPSVRFETTPANFI